MQLTHAVKQLGTETAFKVLAKAKNLEAQGKDIVHLEIGQPDFPTPENISAATREQHIPRETPLRGAPTWNGLRSVLDTAGDSPDTPPRCD